ncbi:MAG TPA: hypothetical protein VGC30_05080, partial [Dokdonella sp.]
VAAPERAAPVATPAPAPPDAATPPASGTPTVHDARTMSAPIRPAPQPARTPPPAAPTSSIELRRDLQLAPDEWLAHVRELLHEGRRQQAIESLRLFRRAHPRAPLPPELEPLAN